MPIRNSVLLLAIGWIGVFVACAFVQNRALSAAEQITAPPIYSSGRVLYVGPTRDLKAPSEAAVIARRGDRVAIDPGTYFDCAIWRAPDISLVGVGPGYADIRGVSCDGKALWVFYDGPARVENVRFSGAKARWRNGAGIRWEGRGWLVVEKSSFVRNEMAILTHNKHVSSLYVADSTFDDNGFCDTYCGHAIYAGLIAKTVIWNSVFRNTRFGHHIKSRALESQIIGNRLSDGVAGTASYAINMPNSGSGIIRGNKIQKGPKSDNIFCAICIGEEIVAPGKPRPRTGVRNPSAGIVIEDNKFLNDSGRSETVFVWNRGGDPVTLRGNKLSGPGAEYFLGPRPELKKDDRSKKPPGH
jgi:hypothetical protein